MRWLVLFLLGCGRFAFEPDTDAATLVPDDAPRVCWDAWLAGVPALTAPQRLIEIAAAGEDHDMALTTDGLQLYFSSDRAQPGGTEDMYVARREQRFGAFTQVDPVPSLNSAMGDGPFFTRDGLRGVLASDRAGTNGAADLWMVERASLDQPFTVTNAGSNVNTNAADYDAWLSIDELRLYYVSNETVLLSTRGARTDVWPTPVPVASINTSGEWDVSLSPDERVIVFTSFRTGAMRDVFVAVRSTLLDGFGTPRPIDAINTAGQDYDPHISADGCELFYASRIETPGMFGIYFVRVVD